MSSNVFKKRKKRMNYHGPSKDWNGFELDLHPDTPKWEKARIRHVLGDNGKYELSQFRTQEEKDALKTSQAERILIKFGGPQSLHRCLVEHFGDKAPTESTIYRWLYDPEHGGTGGRIPYKFFDMVLMAARREGIQFQLKELAPVVY